MLTKWICVNRTLSVGPRLIPRTADVKSKKEERKIVCACAVLLQEYRRSAYAKVGIERLTCTNECPQLQLVVSSGDQHQRHGG